MPVAVRWVLAIVVTIVIVMSLAIGAAVAAIYRGGTLAVDVRDGSGGTNIAVGVPAGVANLAIALVPSGAIPLEEIAPIADELKPLLPAAQALIDELQRLPDFVLVEVESPDQHVVVRKAGRKMIVSVDSQDGKIEVSLPLTTVRQFWNKLERVVDRL